jgi:SAM-dependent methyltransferase
MSFSEPAVSRMCLPDSSLMPQDMAIIDGFRCYAPALALGSEDYPIDLYDRLCRLEEGHFWFQARNRIILRMLRSYLGNQIQPRLLEIGCGTGFVLQRLAAENRYQLIGLESHIAGLRHARSRLPSVEFVQADARELPYNSELDAIGAFDVIEHVAKDEAVLASIHRALKPGGIVIVTVPQHRWLWSATDEQAMHKRRYTRQELSAKLVTAGLEILRCTSFVTVLLPVMYASRLTKRRSNAASESDLYELEISRAANTVCSAAMRIDEALIGLGISLPFGGSLLAVARKKS